MSEQRHPDIADRTEEGRPSVRRQLARLRRASSRISVQLYAGIGGAVLLTIAASIVGWFSFNRVGDLQGEINEVTIPEIAAAFGVAQYTGTLVSAGPRIASASTNDNLTVVFDNTTVAHQALEERLTLLEQTVGDNSRFPVIRSHADSLISNIHDITDDKAQLIRLEQLSETLRAELAVLSVRLDNIVTPALDDQFFYTMTGYRELGESPSPRSEHFSESELHTYRYISDLQADGNIATQLLAAAFGISDHSAIEPLQERFESAEGRIESSLAGLEEHPLSLEVVPIYQRLFQLGLGENSGFDLLAQQQRLVNNQRELLALNQDIAIDMISEVDALVAESQASAQQTTASSGRALVTGSALLLAITVVSVIGALLIAWLFVGRVILSRLQILSGWMRRMSRGDLEYRAEIGGQDEIADMAEALEVFRRHALEVQRLNMIERLANELQDKNDELETVLADLHRAQNQIVMREKLAALGELTAGVAHEIRNPLNFVKNFSEASEDLLDELRETLDESATNLDKAQQELVEEISGELVENLGRIRSHGERADRIVHDMLMMGRDTGELQLTDLNRLLDQNARLAYHSARALDAELQMTILDDLDPDVGEVSVIPQDLGRVFLNMVANACDATAQKRQESDASVGYDPTIWLTSRRMTDGFEIRIRDNGNGIPLDIADKIFNPFFTTKPTDKGTGLGLAISSDIIRQHGGAIDVQSEPGKFTEMIIKLPLEPMVIEDPETAVAGGM